MKRKYIAILALTLFCLSVTAQNVTTLTFTGKDKKDNYVQLDRVSITNQTKRWQEVIYYPDTVLCLGETGVDENVMPEHFRLFQNHPNPFNGITDFSLQLNNDENVVLEIFDITGKKLLIIMDN